MSGRTTTDEPSPEAPLRAAAARKGSLARTLKAVAWSFFGVRRSAEHERDLGQINPLHLIVAALGAGALFVAALVLVVNWVTRGAG